MVVVSQNARRKPLLKLGAKWREEYDMAGKKWRRPASVVGGGLVSLLTSPCDHDDELPSR